MKIINYQHKYHMAYLVVWGNFLFFKMIQELYSNQFIPAKLVIRVQYFKIHWGDKE